MPIQPSILPDLATINFFFPECPDLYLSRVQSICIHTDENKYMLFPQNLSDLLNRHGFNIMDSYS